MSLAAANTDGHAEVDWEAVNLAIRGVWMEFAVEVQCRWPHIKPRLGRTLTHLLLFSYSAFEVPSAPQIDPVIAGVDFARSRTRRGIVVRADLSGEASGQIWLELPPREVPEEQEAIRLAGEELARQLSAKVDEVHAALREQNPVACP